MSAKNPAHNCPACPSCNTEIGTPIVDLDGGRTTDRCYGPNGSTLWCPACGHGWVGTAVELARAQRALEAYYAQEDGREPRHVDGPEEPDPRQLDLVGGPR